MKFKPHGVLLSLFLALGLVFSFGIDASGTHDGPNSGITAQEVAANPNETNMKAFVNHIANYYNGIRDQHDPVADRAELIRELTIFARDIRREGGDYRHGEVYAMGITDNNVITNHARYPELIGYKVDPDAGTPLANTFKALLSGSAIGTTNCEDYGQNRVACAAKVESDFTVDVTNIAGLHHEADLDNLDTAFVEPDCNGLTLETTAEDVFDDPSDANLEAYVKDVIGAVQREVAKITEEELIDLFGPSPSIPQLAGLADPTSAEYQTLNGNTTTKIQERLFCFGSGDFKHENIYAFIMGADLENSTVLVNGNNFDLNGADLELEDNQLSGEKNIAKLFNNELGNPVNGASTYVNYHWDDPVNPDDNVENFFEDRKVPGTSPKRSYIEVANLYEMVPEAVSQLTGGVVPANLVAANFPPQLFIFGSGVYPEEDDTTDDMMDDDMTDDDMTDDDMTETGDAVSGGGCTITGTSNTSQGALLNLFMMASVLFSVVFLRRRA